MQVTPEEMRDMKEHVSKLRSMVEQLEGLTRDFSLELDVMERRLAFMSYPAGRALDSNQIKAKQKERRDRLSKLPSPESYSENVLNFTKKEY